MVRKFFVLCLAVVCVFSLTGCTMFRQKNLEEQALRNQVQALESQIQEKDQEIVNLRDSLAKEMQTKEETRSKVSRAKLIPEVRSRPNNRQVQIALKNAGYDPGTIDGKLGKKTVAAVKAFQKDKGLKADGKVGKLTWDLLREHLDVQTK